MTVKPEQPKAASEHFLTENARLREALDRAGDQFDFYAREHREKARVSRGNGLNAAADASEEKALTNQAFAAMCRAAGDAALSERTE